MRFNKLNNHKLHSIIFVLDRVHLVRYEDISLNPTRLSFELLQFLDLRISSNIQNYILNHTQGKIDKGAYGTYRNSTKEAFDWIHNISKNDTVDVEAECAESMKILGYNPITNIEESHQNENFEILGPLLEENLQLY